MLAELEKDFSVNHKIITKDSVSRLKVFSRFKDYFGACMAEHWSSPIELPWAGEGDEVVAEPLPGSIVPNDQLAQYVPQDPELPDKSVEFWALRLNFAFEYGGAKEFCEFLVSCGDDEYLRLPIVERLMNEIWERTRPAIMKYLVLPYAIYFTLFIGYISFFITDLSQPSTLGFIVLPLCMIFSVLQIALEVTQMAKLGIDYIADVGAIWNVLDLWSSGMVIFFSIDHLSGSPEVLRMKVVGALAVFSLWLKVFYFLRLFE